MMWEHTQCSASPVVPSQLDGKCLLVTVIGESCKEVAHDYIVLFYTVCLTQSVHSIDNS